MKNITDQSVLAAWELKDGELLMLSTIKIQSGQAVPLEEGMLAYGYTPRGGAEQYRPLGACDEEGMPLGSPDKKEGEDVLLDVPAEQVSPPSDEAPPQIAEIPLPVDEQPPAPPDAPLPG